MFKYDVSDRTDIMFGLQGIPGFEFSFKDYVQGENDYKQKTYLMQIQNRTNYFGYDIWASTGIKIDDLKYSDPSRAFESYKYSTFFVQVYLGY
jgi:hypothetical protein